MKTLPQNLKDKKNELQSSLNDKFDALNDAIVEANEDIRQKFDELTDNLDSDDVKEYIGLYNETKQEHLSCVNDALQTLNDFLSDKLNPFMAEVSSYLSNYGKDRIWDDPDEKSLFTSWENAWDTEFDTLDLDGLPDEDDLTLKMLIGVDIDNFEPSEIDEPCNTSLDVFGFLPENIEDV